MYYVSMRRVNSTKSKRFVSKRYASFSNLDDALSFVEDRNARIYPKYMTKTCAVVKYNSLPYWIRKKLPTWKRAGKRGTKVFVKGNFLPGSKYLN